MLKTPTPENVDITAFLKFTVGELLKTPTSQSLRATRDYKFIVGVVGEFIH